jgi:hypothetical protein
VARVASDFAFGSMVLLDHSFSFFRAGAWKNENKKK